MWCSAEPLPPPPPIPLPRHALLTCCDECDDAALEHATPQLAPLYRTRPNLVLQGGRGQQAERQSRQGISACGRQREERQKRQRLGEGRVGAAVHVADDGPGSEEMEFNDLLRSTAGIPWYTLPHVQHLQLALMLTGAHAHRGTRVRPVCYPHTQPSPARDCLQLLSMRNEASTRACPCMHVCMHKTINQGQSRLPSPPPYAPKDTAEGGVACHACTPLGSTLRHHRAATVHKRAMFTTSPLPARAPLGSAAVRPVLVTWACSP